jgi:MtaA/CmuA family methyltransferase
MKEMNSLERCLTVLQGGIADRVPVVPQSFLFAAESAGVKVGELARNARKMVETQVASQQKCGYDGCVIDFDDATLAEACGAKVIYREDEPAIVDESQLALADLRDVDNLKLPDPWSDGRLPIWLEATRMLVDRIGDHVFVMGRADQGPFDLACLLRGPQHLMVDLMDEANHEAIDRLIDYSRKACELFAKAQKEAGAHATSIGEAFAGPNLISPAMYRRFALEPQTRLIEETQAFGIPMSLHICGNTNWIIGDMAATGAKILEIDWQVDMAEARRIVPESTILMGNVNPSDPLVLGTPEQVENAARNVIIATRGRGLFLSSGCAMGRNTPLENVQALVAAARNFGTHDQIMAIES